MVLPRLHSGEIPVAEPGWTFAVVDHYAPTRGRAWIEDPNTGRMISTLEKNAETHGIRDLRPERSKAGYRSRDWRGIGPDRAGSFDHLGGPV